MLLTDAPDDCERLVRSRPSRVSFVFRPNKTLDIARVFVARRTFTSQAFDQVAGLPKSGRVNLDILAEKVSESRN